ncbi:MAG: type I restriction enzyme HsdR N-terminal domain-containing protein [Planctomycetes bacterium]|nr:type I restriction enzyme HsdR N-terminal domain-containing protein [Planctomycetota bacterium]
MKFEDKYSPLESLDLRILADSDFKEDSVREEIISPILKALGYSASKPNKIVRSKGLTHPFVSIGSARKKISCIPDYLLEVNERYAWVLEAKAPREEIVNSKHVEQAYSYAIDSEIRVPLFALCNGKEFVLYHISKPAPILHFDMRELPSYWDNLKKYLCPNNVLSYEFKLAKDFGLHIKRLGFDEFTNLIFPLVPIPFIAQLSEDQYTFSAGIKSEEGDDYVMSFDFETKVMRQFSGQIPENALEILLSPFKNKIKKVAFVDRHYYVNIDCRVGEFLQENEDEIFLPLWVNRLIMT